MSTNTRNLFACVCLAWSAATALLAAESPSRPSAEAAAAKPPSTADALASPEEEAELLKRIVWPSHEPLAFLERRDGVKPEVRAEYERYHTPENVAIVARLLGPGGMYTSHFYKGLGLKHETEEMERGLALAADMRRRGMGVCLYIGGTLHSPTVYEDHPEAREWRCIDADGKPIPYMMGQVWRHYPCVNHPDYRAYIRRLCDIAIDRAAPDMIWFDNNTLRPEPQSCRCEQCRQKFPRRVMAKYSDKQRIERFGRADVSDLKPPEWPKSPPPAQMREIDDPVAQEWIDFRCENVREFFVETAAYVRKLKPDCLVALNIKGIHGYNICFAHGIDHGRWDLGLLNSCDAGLKPGVGPQGNLIGEFRSFKLSHTTGLSTIDGHGDLGNLLGIVINRQLQSPRLGCVPANGHAMYTFGELGRFLKTRNATLYGQRPIYMDVAVLRSWPAMAYNSVNWLHGPFVCEQGLWQSRIPFGIVFDRNLKNLSAHRVVLLANQDALADETVARLKAFVEAGGGLVATGATGRLSDWRRPRTVNALTEAFGLAAGDKPEQKTLGRGRVAYLPELEAPTAFRGGEALRGKHADTSLPPKNWPEVEAALRWAAGGKFRFAVQGAPTVAAEFREGPTPRDRVVHLINFAEKPANEPVEVEMDDEGRDWTLKLDSPDPLPKEVPAIRRAEGRVKFTVPSIGRYTACILSPAAAARATEITNSVGMKMMPIVPGEFVMGQHGIREESPAHKVKITKPFALAATEVTCGQWRAVIGAEPPDMGLKEQTDQHPVVGVTWFEAVDFCKRLSAKEGKTYRLPTEAEWEYACRAGTTTAYWFGEKPDLANMVCEADPPKDRSKPYVRTRHGPAARAGLCKVRDELLPYFRQKPESAAAVEEVARQIEAALSHFPAKN